MSQDHEQHQGARCRHCEERIRLCDCGARGIWRDERRHWADLPRNSRWCRAPINKLHEPEFDEVEP